MSSYSFIVHLPLATGWVNSTRLCWMGMDSINGFPLPPRSTGRVEDIEKGFTSLAGLWGLKLGCAPPFLEKKERLEAEDCTWKWKLCLPKTIFWIRGLPPVSISCQVCSLPRYSHSNYNCVTNNKEQYQLVHQWFKCSAQKRFKDLWRQQFPNRSMGNIF